MPVKSRFFSLAGALFPAMLSAQTTYNMWGPVSAAKTALPSEGAAAARINPASLADVHWASAAYGHAGSVSGKDETEFYQLAVGAPLAFLPRPVRLAAGFGYMSQGGKIDQANTVYRESESDPALAVRIAVDPEERLSLSVGVGLQPRRASSDSDSFITIGSRPGYGSRRTAAITRFPAGGSMLSIGLHPPD